MRNLSILRDSICNFPVGNGDHDVKLCTDSDTSHIYAADVTHSTVCCLSGLNQVRSRPFLWHHSPEYCDAETWPVVARLSGNILEPFYQRVCTGVVDSEFEKKLGGHF